MLRLLAARQWRVVAVMSVCMWVMATGCARDGGSVLQVTTRDSLGVDIVDVPEVAMLPRLEAFEPRPFLRLGGLHDGDLDEEFNPRHPWLAGVMLSDGTFVVNDATHLKFFDSQGKLLLLVGGEGSGPGEFRSIREVSLMPGDTLAAFEYGTSRMSIFTPSGQLVRTVQVEGDIGFQPGLADGTFLMTKAGSSGGAQTQGTDLVRIASDGREVAELGRVPEGFPGLIFREVQVIAHGDQYLIADGERYELRVYAADGTLLTIVRSQTAPVAVTNSIWNEIVEETIPLGVDGTQRSAMLEMLNSGPRPSHFPAYGRIIRGSNGTVWVEDYAREPTRSWTVFARDGVPIGRVSLDSDTGQIATVGSDFIALRRHDENGAVELLFHRLTLTEMQQ